MIKENELPTWKVVHIESGNDDVVSFVFECNEVTTHNNEEENHNITISLNNN